MKRLATGALCLAALLGGSLTAAHQASAKKMAAPSQDFAPLSKAVTPAILDAVATELERAMGSLRIPGAPAPYFIAYKLTEVDVNDVVASLGSVTEEKERDFVTIEAHVHVGSYDKDNSNFIATGRENLDGTVTVPMALEASPARARRSAWIATDAAYKEAIEQWRAKNEAISSGASAGSASLPSYTRAKPIVMESPVRVEKLADNERLKTRAEAVSAAFRKHEHVRDSRVAFTSFLENRWYLNSEGTNATDTRRVDGVIIIATSQAEDGQEIVRYFTRYARSERGLPSDAELIKEADRLAVELDQLRKAPSVDNYTGPVLFEGEGAVGIVRYTLADHLTGTPPPVGVSSNDALLAGKLAGRKGLKVISDLLSIADDPTLSQLGKNYLIGSYKFDDEGVAPSRVEVIKNGKLEELLMSRTPSADQTSSNGHARLSMAGGVFRGSPTNLIVTGKKGQSRKQLIKKLTTEAKNQGLPYAIVIKQLDDVAITANPELSRLALFQVLQSMNPQAPPRATLAYRVYPDGREEMVRGVQLEPVDMRAWRDVFAVGKGSTVKNFLASTDDRFLKRIAGTDGRVPSAGIESAISTPDLLFRELDLRRSKFGLRPPAIIPAPK